MELIKRIEKYEKQLATMKLTDVRRSYTIDIIKALKEQLPKPDIKLHAVPEATCTACE